MHDAIEMIPIGVECLLQPASERHMRIRVNHADRMQGEEDCNQEVRMIGQGKDLMRERKHDHKQDGQYVGRDPELATGRSNRHGD